MLPANYVTLSLFCETGPSWWAAHKPCLCNTIYMHYMSERVDNGFNGFLIL